ncbi:MAG: hypothetical protein NUV40_00790 [Patescibacteria group bacterium]|nr:hypothetical protein [Patescibacteria group bacterium]
MRRLKERLKNESRYLRHDISALWVSYNPFDILSFFFFALLVSPAWVLGFILSASGWYEITDS